MASRTRSLNQENGFGFPYSAGAKLGVSNLQHGGKLLGKKMEGIMKTRRPLQELNSINMENLGSSKALEIGASKRTNRSIADKPKQEKAKKNGGRRALGDLTNLNKFQGDASSQKSSTLKLPSVVEKEEMVPDPAEEGYLHDHRECMKAQRNGMDIDYFLETVGLRKDCSTPIATRKLLPSIPSKLESPTRIGFAALTPTASKQLESPMMHRYEDIDALEFGIELDFSGFKVKDSPSR